MNRKGSRPRISLGLDFPGAGSGYRKVLPFRRSWLAIAVLAGLDAVLLIPALSAARGAAEHWSTLESLFELVFALFMSAWLLGWSVGVFLVSAILVAVLFGREVIRAEPGQVEILFGLPGIGAAAVYDAAKMRNLRHTEAPEKSGTSWRGAHLLFDYGANTVAVGSDISLDEASEMIRLIETEVGRPIRHGAARPEELETSWEPEKSTVATAPSNEPAEPPKPQKPQKPLTLGSPSSLVLVAANLVPVAGTAFLGWNLSDVMVLYWAESAIIGFFTACKMAVIGRWMALLAIPFFVGHFGAFMAVHFLFIYLFFVEGLNSGSQSGGDLASVGRMFVLLWPALAALFISHAWSYFQNFLGRREYRNRTIKNQMSEPYSRIIFMHLVIIFGGGLALVLGAPEPVIIGVIAIKIYVDLKAHIKEHKMK